MERRKILATTILVGLNCIVATGDSNDEECETGEHGE